ncbi:P-loop ATPase [Streptococcus criceti]|uniref:KAP NTPase domain-containing protein n=1 Tax=Streptococcus criceti HS-6 TaxID=873449 RepID=G5JQ76_STRCG|nr:P-loop NTPase fold protein [Streptococcus criceti]EHI75344.1 hypothetical protein STRCR_1759 [Streptococcus criceti HS-6]SUN43135.1 P-loop ATPase [Streptococcus criceti]
MDSKQITLVKIDTKTAAKNIANLLNDKDDKESKTYFLNGAWGSGKSTFLREVKKVSDNKFIEIDLWRLNDNRSLIEVAFSNLYPCKYRCYKLRLIFLVALSILFTLQFNLGIERFFSTIFKNFTPPVTFLAGLIALCGAVYQFFKPKSDVYYSNKLEKYVIHDKILLIDDFDRLTKEQQNEAYKLFSLLKGKLPIVFVGDIEKVYQKTSDNFLSKIIDRRLDLPFDLHPSNIWNEYFKELESNYDVALSNNFKQQFIIERRNLRDRVHFNDYVTKELIDGNKYGRVQIEQMLVVIYIYLFYPDGYNKLFNDEIPILLSDEVLNDEDIPRIFKQILAREIQQTPRDFLRSKRDYYIFEAPRNLSNKELYQIFKDENKLKDNILTADINSDFYVYLQSKYDSLTEDEKDFLLTYCLQVLTPMEDTSSSLSFIFDRMTQQAIEEVTTPYDIPDADDYLSIVYNFWKVKFEELNNDDLSLILYLLVTYVPQFGMGFPLWSTEDLFKLSSAKFKNYRFKLLYLNYYLTYNKLKILDDCELLGDEFWESVKSLENDDFIDLMIKQRIFTPIDKNFYQFNPEGKIGEKIYQLTQDKINELTKNGYLIISYS